MKFFRKYIFPALFGLLIYSSIRLVNDVISQTQFWKRDWVVNFIEIIASILIGYVFDYIVRYFLNKFSASRNKRFTLRTLLKEFAMVYLCCLLTLMVTIIPIAALTDDGLQWHDVIYINLIPVLYLLLYYAIARGNILLKFTYEQQVQLEKIRSDQLQTELKFLKAQYHPHFLFNALNTVYFQMDEDVGAAKKTLEQFSELLRYQLYDQQRMVPVSQEVSYLKNFIELQSMRSSEKLQLNLQIDPALQQQQIYPLLLLPLVENAFKYVGGAYCLLISLTMQEDWLELLVENSLPAYKLPDSTGGIGLENLRRRLHLLYPDAHSLLVETIDSSFIAQLKIKLSVCAVSS